MLRRLVTSKPFLIGTAFGAVVATTVVLAVTLPGDGPDDGEESPAASTEETNAPADAGRAFQEVEAGKGAPTRVRSGGSARGYYEDMPDYYRDYFGFEEEEEDEGQVYLVPSDDGGDGGGSGQPGEPGEPGIPDGGEEDDDGAGVGGPGGPGGEPGGD